MLVHIKDNNAANLRLHILYRCADELWKESVHSLRDFAVGNAKQSTSTSTSRMPPQYFPWQRKADRGNTLNWRSSIVQLAEVPNLGLTQTTLGEMNLQNFANMQAKYQTTSVLRAKRVYHQTITNTLDLMENVGCRQHAPPANDELPDQFEIRQPLPTMAPMIPHH